MNQKTKMGYTSQKGITLIALVITIIVLLILAGVTISMVLGEDGIIGQAQEAKQAQEKAELKEKIQIWNGNVKAAEYSNKKITEEEYNKFKTEVEALAEKAGIEVDVESGEVEIDGEEVAVQMPSNIDTRRDIKFTVDGIELVVKEGMTWRDLVNNPDMWSAEWTNCVVDNDNGGIIRCTLQDGYNYWVYTDLDPTVWALADEVIEEGYYYGTIA